MALSYQITRSASCKPIEKVMMSRCCMWLPPQLRRVNVRVDSFATSVPDHKKRDWVNNEIF